MILCLGLVLLYRVWCAQASCKDVAVITRHEVLTLDPSYTTNFTLKFKTLDTGIMLVNFTVCFHKRIDNNLTATLRADLNQGLFKVPMTYETQCGKFVETDQLVMPSLIKNVVGNKLQRADHVEPDCYEGNNIQSDPGPYVSMLPKKYKGNIKVKDKKGKLLSHIVAYGEKERRCS